MSRLKLDVRQWKNAVSILVLEQDSSLYNGGCLVNVDGFEIHSRFSPEIYSVKKLYVRGNASEGDNKVASKAFETVAQANLFINDLRKAVAELNKGSEGAAEFGCSREILGGADI